MKQDDHNKLEVKIQESEEIPQARIEAIGAQLRAKISSKFQTSSVLIGFCFALLTIQISIHWDSDKAPPLLPVSIAIMLAAIILYATAMIKLDGLTMPKRFWPEDPNALGPRMQGLLRDKDLWELYNQTVFWWFCLVVVGTVLTAVSLLAMLFPVSFGKSIESLPRFTIWFACGGIVAAVIYLGVIFMIASRKFSALVRPLD